MGVTNNKVSIVFALLGVLAMAAKGFYIHPPEPAAMETAIGLTAGIFLLGLAWAQAGGRFVPARDSVRMPVRARRR